MEIDSKSPSYVNDVSRWILSQTIIGGTESMRAAGKALLPQEEGESDKAYANRLLRSVFYNRYAKAVREVTGKIIEGGFQLSGDISPELITMLEDCDHEQRDLNQFLSEVCQESVIKGVSYVLVEYPVTAGAILTREQEQQANIRPYLVHIKPEQLFYFQATEGQLEVIRFFEDIVEEVSVVTQIREITPNTWSTYRQNEKGEWAILDSGEMTLGAIPLVALYARRTGFMSARPPLEDLMHINIKHWQSSSDQSHILHVARVPILFGTGLEDGIFEMGPNRLVRAEQGATLSFVEHTGKAIQAGAADLEALETQMEAMSMAPLLNSKPGVQTATAHSIDSAEAQSILQLIRLSWEDAANLLLYYFSKWSNIPVSGLVKLNSLTSSQLSPDVKLAEISKARAIGDLSRRSYLAALRDYGILSEDFDIDAEDSSVSLEMGSVNVNQQQDIR